MNRNDAIRQRCPQCRVTTIYFSKLKEKWLCRSCNTHFEEPFVGRKFDEVKKSGQVAGRIEVGRGSVWNAGLV